MADDNKNVLFLAAAAIGGYYLYTQMVAVPAGVPTTGAWNGYQPTGGGSRTAPKQGDTWTDGQKVVAMFNGSAWAPYATTLPAPAPAPPAAAPPAPQPVGNPPSPVNPGPPVPTPAASARQTIVNAINASGVSSTFIYGQQTPDVWNWYAMSAFPGWTAPAPELLYPGVPNAHKAVGFDDWFGRVSQYLPGATAGMSGFGRAPMSVHFHRLYGGWMA